MSNVFFYEPFYDFDRLLDEALWRHPNANTQNNQLQRQTGSGSVDGAVRSFKPRMDLHEDAEKNIVTATFELPGVNKEDVSINLGQGGRLTIGAEMKQSSTETHPEHGYAVRERRYGKYARTLTIPQGIKDEDIKASMDNGVLTVTFPKTSAEQAPRKIAVN